MNRRFSLTFKVLVGFIAVTTVPIGLLLYNNFYGIKVVREEVSESNYYLLLSQGKQMEKALQESRDYLLRLISSDLTSPDLFTLANAPSSSSDYFFAMQRLDKSFRDNMTIYRNVETFFTYSKREDQMNVTSRNYRATEAATGIWREKFQDFRPEDGGRWHSVDRAGESYLLMAFSFNADVVVGAYVNAQDLLAPLADVRFGENGSAFLTFGNEKILSRDPVTTARSDVLRTALGNAREGSEPVTFHIGDTRHLLIEYPFSDPAFRLAAIFPERELLQKLPYIQMAGYLIPAAGLLVVAAYFLFLKRVLHRPMNGLVVGMRRIIRGEVDFEVSAKGASREFEFLTNTFNRMIAEIRHLKIDVYEESLKNQQAEFKHLQAQIQPHFYLNSLNVIYSLSKLNENELVCKMTEHLADYFRFIMRAHQDTIRLAEEMAHIRNYLEIQMLRFDGRLAYELNVPAYLEGVPILPLAVQPFVENAVIHGMKRGRARFEVRVEARRSADEPEWTEIRVSDNGRGFPTEQLARLQNGEYAQGDGLQNLGIWNVNRRMRMIYGDQFRLSFANREGAGAEVVLAYRANERSEGGDADDAAACG
ncbi:sensor histidine kinase [Cohnella sp. GCM10027633]|uniref:sensor histidine kinase n=1 Tax=unclassified Cohnella TaxID=2636738 RepID=UPI0036376E8D